MKTQIEPIAKRHVRDKFDCGDAALNQYLVRFARQNDTKGVAKAFVALDEHGQVVGYYTLSAAEVAFDDLPAEQRKHLPKYPVPAARIGRLAVDQSVQGQGLGGDLLIDALLRVLAAADHLGVRAIIVDAKDKHAKQFYQHYGFSKLADNPRTLFLPLNTARKLF